MQVSSATVKRHAGQPIYNWRLRRYGSSNTGHRPTDTRSHESQVYMLFATSHYTARQKPTSVRGSTCKSLHTAEPSYTTKSSHVNLGVPARRCVVGERIQRMRANATLASMKPNDDIVGGHASSQVTQWPRVTAISSGVTIGGGGADRPGWHPPGRQVFQEKIEGWHPQLPPRVSPTLVTPLAISKHLCVR